MEKLSIWQLAILVAFVYWLLVGCANPIPPTGGPRDETPPQLDTLNSTKNYQTRFEKQTIVLAFDEWVELKDAFNQVIVSPPLEFRPDILRKKKTIQFNFDEREVLRDSATYVINFGEAIRDLTEGNPAPIVYVFSTGDYIDSLSVEGRIIDAYTSEPAKDVLFLMYENLADSVFRSERPFYFAKTDESGNFKVNNVKSGTFKATALVDQNLNYKFDSEAEKVAFLDSNIVLSGEIEVLPPGSTQLDSLPLDTLQVDALLPDTLAIDTSQLDTLLPNEQRTTNNKQQPILLRLFEEEKRLFLQDDDVEKYGLVKLTFNREPYDATVTYDSVGQAVFFEKELDTIRLWYNLEDDIPWNVYVQRDTLTDTVEVEAGLRQNFLASDTLKPSAKAPTRLPVQTPGRPFEIVFNHPLATFDTSLIRLFEDSTKVPVRPFVSIDPAERRKLLIDFEWKGGLKYESELATGGIADIFGLVTADTVRRSLMAGAVEEYGTLTLKVGNLRPDAAYVVRLLDKGEKLIRTFQVTDTSDFQTTMPLMPPDVYTVELIEDLDRNGRWTTGSYDLNLQPERVRKKTLEELRANWELEAEVRWTDEVPVPRPTTGTPTTGGPPTNTPPSGNRPGGGRGNR